MKQGDFLYIDYVGRVKDTGEIFDLTRQDVAQKEGIYNPNLKYKPLPVVIGGNFVLKGLDEVLLQMSIGEKKTVEIPVEKAFGERKPELIRLVPMSTFQEQNIDPNPGSYVTINGLNGRIISSSGGRIRVDFNHPLAGKKLEYDVEAKEEIKETSDKIFAVISYYYPNLERSDVEMKFVEKEVELKIKADVDMHNNVKRTIADTIMKWVEINKVRFVDEYERK